jgi:hypothetical protein
VTNVSGTCGNWAGGRRRGQTEKMKGKRSGKKIIKHDSVGRSQNRL